MARAITSRGLRSLQANVQLPREVQSASALANRIKARASDIARAQLRPDVEAIVDEEFAQSLMEMQILRDPHTSMWGRIYWALDDSGATTPQEADIFKTQAAGAAATGVAGTWNNLLSDRDPLKPSLIHNIGLSVYIASDAFFGEELDVIMGRAMCALKRDKDSIFEFPVVQAVTSLVLVDASGVAATVIDINPLDQGGLEVEGHGAPFLLTDSIGLEISFPTGGQFQQLAVGKTGLVAITGRVDGEVMEL